MNIELKGKNAVVCGSTEGIGKAIAIELAHSGATVYLLARNADKLKDLASQLDASYGQQHHYEVADFFDSSQVKEAIAHIVTKAKTIHILVNNSGGPAPGTAIQSDIEAFQKAFNQHLINNHILVQTVVNGMKAAQYGRIINIISTSVKAPIEGLGVSNTTRGAVASWAKTISNELGPFGITVNNILPGLTQTGRLSSLITQKAKAQGVSEETIADKMKSEVPARRFASPEETAALATFLASPFAGYINGTSIRIDGGKTPVI